MNPYAWRIPYIFANPSVAARQKCDSHKRILETRDLSPCVKAAALGLVTAILIAAGLALLASVNIFFSFPLRELNGLSFELLIVGITCLLLALVFGFAWKKASITLA